MEKLLWTIGEAAKILGESVSLVRFWTNSFPKFLKPSRNAKGNRFYTAQDIETLKKIHFLVKEKGFSLEGAAQALVSDEVRLSRKVRALDSLKEIRARLMEIKKTL